MARGEERGRASMGKRVTVGDLILMCAMKRARPGGKDQIFCFCGCRFLHPSVPGKNKGNSLIVLEKTYGSLYLLEKFKVLY
jgi:hypothetical protein